MPGLFHAIVKRREPERPKTNAGNLNVRVAEHFPWHAAPDPVRQSDFTNVGRAYGRARIQVFSSTHRHADYAISEQNINGVGIRLLMPSPAAQTPRGGMAGVGQRTNTDRGNIIAYGSLLERAGAIPQ